MLNRFQMTWDENELALAFKVKVADIREYLTDGRRVSFIIERRLKWENPGWTLAKSEGAGHDLLDPDGGLWEVRSSLPSRREARVLFGFYNGIMVALHAFIKKTQKTVPEELALARQRLKEVLS